LWDGFLTAEAPKAQRKLKKLCVTAPLRETIARKGAEKNKKMD